MHITARSDLFKNEHFYTQDFFEDSLQDDSKKIFVFEESGNILGYCATYTRDYNNHIAFYDTKILTIESIGVCENARGKGIGRQLFGRAKAYAKEIGATRVELNVWAFNKNAKEFYEHLGFTEKSSTMEMKIT